MTNITGEAVAALLEGTTPGPWEIRRNTFAEITGVRCSDGLRWEANDPAHYVNTWENDERSEDERRAIVRARAEANGALIAAAPSIARAYLALSERVAELEAALMIARGHIDGLGRLFSAMSGHDSIAAQPAIERIDATLQKGQS